MDWKSKILTSNLSAVHPEVINLKSLKAALTAKAKSVNLELKRRDVEHLLFHRERAELVTRFPAFVESLQRRKFLDRIYKIDRIKKETEE